MNRSTRMRANKKALANIDLANGLVDVKARAIAGSSLLSALTSLTSLQKLSQVDTSLDTYYAPIKSLLAYERAQRRNK